MAVGVRVRVEYSPLNQAIVMGGMQFMNRKNYELWHLGDLVESAPKTRAGLRKLYWSGAQIAENLDARQVGGTLEIFAADNHAEERVWSYEL